MKFHLTGMLACVALGVRSQPRLLEVGHKVGSRSQPLFSEVGRMLHVYMKGVGDLTRRVTRASG